MFSVIVLCGGTGKRMEQKVPKQFLALAGKPLIMHSLERLDRIKEIDEIILVCHSEYKDLLRHFVDSYMLQKNYLIIDGGETRQESTYLGLIKSNNEKVLIHEAARPFVSQQEFEKIIHESSSRAIFGASIPFTVLQGKGKVDGVLMRDTLINVQLPQKFERNELLDCHRKARDDRLIFTEDASLLYHYTKADIKVLEGQEYNLKITNRLDFCLGEWIYEEYINR